MKSIDKRSSILKYIQDQSQDYSPDEFSVVISLILFSLHVMLNYIILNTRKDIKFYLAKSDRKQ